MMKVDEKTGTVVFEDYDTLSDTSLICPNCGKIDRKSSERKPFRNFVYKCRHCGAEYTVAIEKYFRTYRYYDESGC